MSAATVAWSDQLQDFQRALAGGFLFGIPLIYTLEAWDVGATVPSGRLLLFFVAVFALNLTLVRAAGFKEETTFQSVFVDAIEAMAIGIVGAALLLFVLDRINFSSPVEVVTGRVLIESIPFSLGISLSNLLLRRRGENRMGDDGDSGPNELQALITDIGATIVGAGLVAYAIAPTDEIDILARQLSPLNVMVLVIISLASTFVIVFQSEFSNAEGRRRQPGPFQQPITETVLAYVVALVVSLFLLFVFAQVDASMDWRFTLDQILVLGLPAAIGGAAGRLAV